MLRTRETTMMVTKYSSLKKVKALRRKSHKGWLYACTRSCEFQPSPRPWTKFSTVRKEMYASSEIQACQVNRKLVAANRRAMIQSPLRPAGPTGEADEPCDATDLEPRRM